MVETSSTPSSMIKNKKPSLSPSSHCAINTLPDCLLIYMLSFLSLDDAFRTGFISRRFRNLWKQLPALDFTPKLRIKPPFAAFVDRLLSLYEAPSIRRLRAAFFYQESDASSVHCWIRFAFEHHVQELELILFPLQLSSPRLSFALPTTSTSLKSLKLQHFDISLTGITRFQSLEVVMLSYNSLDGAVITSLISSSPRLSILDIKRCKVNGDLSIVDSRGQLAWLRVGLWSEIGVLESKVVIHAQNLKFLEVNNHIPKDGFNLSCPSLLTATFDFQDMSFMGEALDWYRNLVRLLNAVAHATCVSLCSWCIKMFYKWRAEIITASRLDAGHLSLSTSMTKKEFHGIALLLVKFHQVDTLSVSIHQRHGTKGNHLMPGYEDQQYWKLEELLSPGLPHLKNIEVNNFLGSEYFDMGEVQRMEAKDFFGRNWGNEMKFVEFFLKKCRNLERITIRSSILEKLCAEGVNSDLTAAILGKMLFCDRASPDAQVHVI